jgi:PadR family transcriptional regulator, regulatory protein AphA
VSSVRLSSTSYLVLGLIGLRGPSTPYELKRAVERSGIGEFWPFPHTQLYDEPARLADGRLLDEEREEGGRRRRLYRLTDEGQAALNEWIRRPEGGGFQVRDIASLKLFFSELGADTADIVALAQLQQAFHRDRLARYEALDARYADRPDRARRLAPLQFGLHLTRAAIEFWGSVIDHPPGSQDVSTRSPSDGASSDEREP